MTPNFLKVVHVFVSSFSFFPDIKSKLSFLGGLKLQPHHTIPQHWKQAKDFQECLGPGLSSEASLFLFLYVFCWCYSNFLRPFASTSLHRLLSLQKKRNTWFCLRCAGLFCLSNYYAGCRCLVLVPQDLLHTLCFFLGMSYARFFLAFASTSLHRLLSLQKKKHLDLSPLRGAFVPFKLLFRMSLPGARTPGFSSRPLFFLWCPTPVFSSCWIRKPSSATRIANKKHPGRTHKTTKGSQQCLGAGLCSEALFFFWVVFLQFFVLDPEAFIGY